jgi:poly(3-hydroxybutyrate) depolymerase
MSNGGGFIGTLACHPTASNIFAALAAGSGAFYTDVNGPDNGCSPGRKPLPMLEIHGGSDKTVKYVGGEGDGGPQPPIESWLEWWAQRNGCSDKTEETTNDGDVHHVSWSCGGVEGVLQHYRVDSMGKYLHALCGYRIDIPLGHCWADTELNLSQLTVPQGPAPIQASRIVIDFFDQFTKSS